MVIKVSRPRPSLLTIREVNPDKLYEVSEVSIFNEGGRRETGYLIYDDLGKPITVYENEVTKIE